MPRRKLPRLRLRLDGTFEYQSKVDGAWRHAGFIAFRNVFISCGGRYVPKNKPAA